MDKSKFMIIQVGRTFFNVKGIRLEVKLSDGSGTLSSIDVNTYEAFREDSLDTIVDVLIPERQSILRILG